MASPKDFEQKMERMLNVWRALAPEKTFGGMTLAQFEAVVAPAQSARRRIIDLTEQTSKAIAERDAADKVFVVRAQQVVAGVLADRSAALLDDFFARHRAAEVGRAP